MKIKPPKIFYPPEEQEKIKAEVVHILGQRYLGEPSVTDIWLAGSLARGEFGVYQRPYVDCYGVTQEGSDVDIFMVCTAPTEAIQKDEKLQRKLSVRNRGKNCYAFLDGDELDLALVVRHPLTSCVVRHQMDGTIITQYNFNVLQLLHRHGYILDGGPWKDLFGTNPTAIKIK